MVSRISARILCFFALSVLAACASTPSSSPASDRISSKLALCSGVSISNAPSADRNRHIVGYEPHTIMRGKKLLRAPVAACVSSGFGPRRGGAGSFHHGVDLFTRGPSPVYAGGDGVIESVQTLRGYGKTVLITHGRGIKTRYAHLSEYARGLKSGARVSRGEMIGRTGRTGNATAIHLHYEILVDGRRQNPLTVGR